MAGPLVTVTLKIPIRPGWEQPTRLGGSPTPLLEEIQNTVLESLLWKDWRDHSRRLTGTVSLEEEP